MRPYRVQELDIAEQETDVRSLFDELDLLHCVLEQLVGK